MNSPVPSPPRRVFKGWACVLLYTFFWGGIILLPVHWILIPVAVRGLWAIPVSAASLVLVAVLAWLSSFTTVKGRKRR